MITTHKIIKYFAYALAASIFGSIILAFFYLLGFSYGKNNDNKMTNTSYKDIDISYIDIKLANSNLKIETGDYLNIDTNSNDISFKQTDNKLYIKEKSFASFLNSKEDIIIYIPNNIIFNIFNFTSGVGEVDISDLKAKKLSLNLGASNLKIHNLEVIDDIFIKGGVGKINIENSIMNNLDLTLGVGKTDITGVIKGISNINTGVGELNIKLTDEKNNYKIVSSKGIGEINIDGTNTSNNYTYGNGNSYIKIDGGIGSININFK